MKDYRNAVGVELSTLICRHALDAALEPMRNVAREHGYSLAVHGSLARDIDLIAVPWVDRVEHAEVLMNDLKGVCVGLFGRARLDPSGEEWTEKPHGRLAKSIHCYCEGHFFYFDVSIMPPIVKAEEPAHREVPVVQDEPPGKCAQRKSLLKPPLSRRKKRQI